MNSNQAAQYKSEIARLYSQRSHSYDESQWHDRIARKLVDHANLAGDSQVLDIATGTGMVAFYAASRIGPQGSVIGIDIAEGMLETARAKKEAAPHLNLRFDIGDGEALPFPLDTFDFIFCGAALIWMTDFRGALSHWRTRLRSNGRVGFHAFSEDAFVAGTVAQSVMSTYGVLYCLNRPTGTPDKCRALLESAGYRNVEIQTIEAGSYISLEEAKRAWVGPTHPAPGQFPHPMASLTAQQLDDARNEFDRRLEALNSRNGIWNDMTTFCVYGER